MGRELWGREEQSRTPPFNHPSNFRTSYSLFCIYNLFVIFLWLTLQTCDCFTRKLLPLFLSFSSLFFFLSSLQSEPIKGIHPRERFLPYPDRPLLNPDRIGSDRFRSEQFHRVICRVRLHLGLRMMRESILTGKEGTMLWGSAIISPAAVMSLRESSVGVNSPPSGSLMILAPLYGFPNPITCLIVLLWSVIMSLLDSLCFAAFCWLCEEFFGDHLWICAVSFDPDGDGHFWHTFLCLVC